MINGMEKLCLLCLGAGAVTYAVNLSSGLCEEWSEESRPSHGEPKGEWCAGLQSVRRPPLLLWERLESCSGSEREGGKATKGGVRLKPSMGCPSEEAGF